MLKENAGFDFIGEQFMTFTYYFSSRNYPDARPRFCSSKLGCSLLPKGLLV